MRSEVYFITMLDINFGHWGPLSPEENYESTPPTNTELPRVAERLEGALELMRSMMGGKYVIAAHSSVYERTAFYREPFLSLYKRALKDGAEIAIHTHEEVAGMGTLINQRIHMREILVSLNRMLLDAGIRATAFHAGYSSYASYLTPLLEELGLLVELTGAPETDVYHWGAHWKGIPTSPFYLCPVDYTHVECEHQKSKVLEIPVGTDGKGGIWEKNHLIIEVSENDATLKGIWDAILERGKSSGVPQMIHCKWHLNSMRDRDMGDRVKMFLEYALSNSGLPVTASEAKAKHDAMTSEISH